jgi:predicted outer membrane protein
MDAADIAKHEVAQRQPIDLRLLLRFAILALVAMVLSGCAQIAVFRMLQPKEVEPDEFAAAIQAGNEIVMLSQIALSSGSSADVKTYAQRLLAQQPAINEELLRLMIAHGIIVPSQFNYTWLSHLEEMKRDGFDSNYLAAMVLDQDQLALRLWRMGGKRTMQHRDVREFASRVQPAVHARCVEGNRLWVERDPKASRYEHCGDALK